MEYSLEDNVLTKRVYSNVCSSCVMQIGEQIWSKGIDSTPISPVSHAA